MISGEARFEELVDEKLKENGVRLQKRRKLSKLRALFGRAIASDRGVDDLNGAWSQTHREELFKQCWIGLFVLEALGHGESIADHKDAKRIRRGPLNVDLWACQAKGIRPNHIVIVVVPEPGLLVGLQSINAGGMDLEGGQLSPLPGLQGREISKAHLGSRHEDR